MISHAYVELGWMAFFSCFPVSLHMCFHQACRGGISRVRLFSFNLMNTIIRNDDLVAIMAIKEKTDTVIHN